MAMKMPGPKTSRDAAIVWGGALLVFVAAFCFFQFGYQQHLLHREQNNLFLMSQQYIEETYRGIGWLSRLAGDFLTQYFYYIGAGAAILSSALSLMWVLAYVLASQCEGKGDARRARWLAAGMATLLVVWEWLRETYYAYALGSTISIVAILAIANIVCASWRRSKACGAVVAAVLVPLGAWCFWYQHDKLIGKPDFSMERVMAIDNAAYFGHWDKVASLSAAMPESRLAVFYHSLANARQGQLTEAIKDKVLLGPEVLLPRVGPSSSYMRIGASGRAWHLMGDCTMAEHCYMLSMIFSPQNTGTRHLRELAMVNLDNGDAAAAAKYLRMLSLTAVHSRWAADKLRAMPTMPQTASAAPDTIRSANDVIMSLRHLLKVQPANRLAYDYLMNYHLVTGNMLGLKEDFDKSMPNHPWYQQALLISLSHTGGMAADKVEHGIGRSVLAGYRQYVDQYVACKGDMSVMKQRFSDTYWCNYHIIQLSQGQVNDTNETTETD